jgi:hypothetical protein
MATQEVKRIGGILTMMNEKKFEEAMEVALGDEVDELSENDDDDDDE